MRIWLPFALLLSLPLAAACGDDDDASGPTCGTQEAPQFFQVADVTPASGSTVEGLSATQSFRIVGAPGLVDKISFQIGASHTAGSPTPASLSFTVSPEGADLVYTFKEVTWASAGHVELETTTRYQINNCVYALPRTLFSYDVTGTGSGGAGGGGTAGTGGSGAGTAGAGGSEGGSAGTGGSGGTAGTGGSEGGESGTGGGTAGAGGNAGG